MRQSVYSHIQLNVFDSLLYVSLLQVVSGASLAEVASVVIEHVRFPLLDPDSLNTVEKDNTKNYLIPVSYTCTIGP